MAQRGARWAGVVLGWGLAACDPAGSSGPSPAAQATADEARDAPTSGSVELVLHRPEGRPAPSKACDVALCTKLLERIDSAQTSIDFAVYGFRGQPEIASALMRAKERGVRVRGVVDRDGEGKTYYSGTDALAEQLGTLRHDQEADLRRREAQAKKKFEPNPECPQPTGFEGPPQCLAYDLGEECLLAIHASREALDGADAIMHDKFFVIDESWVWTGSTNLSDSGVGGYNANLVALVDAPAVAAHYVDEFERMYTKGTFHNEKPAAESPRQLVLDDGTKVEVLFSPQDRAITDRVRPLLQRASERIDVAVFFLTHKGVAADLIAAHRRGVNVRVVLDATAARNGYTKHRLLREVGIPVKVENFGGKMHMKAAAIDHKVVIAGSMNWTSAGEWDNDENTLILGSEDLATQFHDWFDETWSSIDERWANEDPVPESLASGTACTDGSDNDFDDLRDGEDPDCGANPPARPPMPPHVIVARGEASHCHIGLWPEDVPR